MKTRLRNFGSRLLAKMMRQVECDNKIITSEFEEESKTKKSKEELSEKLVLFDSEPGYFTQVIRPMLHPGHENELVYWLKDLGLIKSSQMCKNSKTDSNCSNMSWIAARSNDMYQWKCNGCSLKKSIREESIFVNVKCSFKNAIRILLGWCKGNDANSMTELLGLKRSVIANLYRRGAAIAEKHISSNIAEFQLGGPGSIVLIDTYPEICGTFSRSAVTKPVLCISEIKSYPQKYWLEPLETPRHNNPVQENLIIEHILHTISRIVCSGSILIIPSNSKLCSQEKFKSLSYLYPVIVNTDDLSRHNNDDENLLDNLDTIWKEVAEICANVSQYTSENVRQYITGHMWRRKYQQNSFEMLVYNLSL